VLLLEHSTFFSYCDKQIIVTRNSSMTFFFEFSGCSFLSQQDLLKLVMVISAFIHFQLITITAIQVNLYHSIIFSLELVS